MKVKNQRTMIHWLPFLLVALLSFVVFVGNTRAQVSNVIDNDSDGLDDIAEGAGLTLRDGTLLPVCAAGAGNHDPCVHPASPDLFVAVARASGGLMPSLPLEFLGNLNRSSNQITGIHELTPAQIDPVTRQFSSSAQKAIRVTESLATVTTSSTNTDAIWGKTPLLGTPNLAGEATVFTQQIANDVQAKYNAARAAGNTSITDAQIQAKIAECIKHTVAHEAGHNLGPLAAQYNSKLGGNHYSTTQQLTMSQGPILSQKGTNVNVVCPATFTSTDATTFKIK